LKHYGPFAIIRAGWLEQGMADPSHRDETSQGDGSAPKTGVASYMLMSFGDSHGPYDLDTVRSIMDKGLPRHTLMTVVIDGIERRYGHAGDLFEQPRFFRVICGECDRARTYQVSGEPELSCAGKVGANFAYRGNHGSSPDPQKSCLQEFFWRCPLRDSESGCRGHIEEGRELGRPDG
jgi:hypothetical protein